MDNLQRIAEAATAGGMLFVLSDLIINNPPIAIRTIFAIGTFFIWWIISWLIQYLFIIFKKRLTFNKNRSIIPLMLVVRV